MSQLLVDCGCTCTVYPDGSGIEMHWCPLHEAAPLLLEVAEEADASQAWDGNDPDEEHWQVFYAKARTAIAKAKGTT